RPLLACGEPAPPTLGSGTSTCTSPPHMECSSMSTRQDTSWLNRCGCGPNSHPWQQSRQPCRNSTTYHVLRRRKRLSSRECVGRGCRTDETALRQREPLRVVSGSSALP